MSRKRIGLIDNLGDVQRLLRDSYERATAAEIMVATGGNTGNVAFVKGVQRIIDDELVRIEWATDPGFVNRELDHIVVCCANQLGEHVDLAAWAERIAAFDLPVTLVGLGAQAPDTSSFPNVPEGTRRFLKLVEERRAGGHPNIAVRGEFTASYLRSIGMDSAPIGCPSLYISRSRELGAKIIARQQCGLGRVAVAAGNPWHGPSALFERKLVDIVERWRGEYVIQHPVAMLQYALGEVDRIESRVAERFQHVYGSRFDQQSLLGWYRRYASVYIDPGNWMRFLSKFDMVVGPRYHGVALAIQEGVPGCVYTIDSRTSELCEGTGIKSLPVEKLVELDVSEILELSRWTVNEALDFDEGRIMRAASYIEFLEGNDLSPSADLIWLSGKAAQGSVA